MAEKQFFFTTFGKILLTTQYGKTLVALLYSLNAGTGRRAPTLQLK